MGSDGAAYTSTYLLVREHIRANAKYVRIIILQVCIKKNTTQKTSVCVYFFVFYFILFFCFHF